MDKEIETTLPDTDDTAAAEIPVAETADMTEVQPEITENVIDLTEEAVPPADDVPTEAPAENQAAVSDTITEDTAEKKHKKKKLLADTLLFASTFFVFVCAVMAAVYYIVFAARYEFHADCTDTILWANASVESGKLYDPSFTYACFLPFSTSTLMIPLIKIFGLCMTAHVGGMLCFFILLTFFMLLMMREITGSTPAGFMGTAIFLSITLATPKLREIFWGHTIYYSLGILFLVIGAFLYSRLLSVGSMEFKLKKEGKNAKGASLHKLLIFLCLCVFMLLTGMDGITGFTLFALPFAGAIFIEQFINKKYSILSGRTALVTFRALVFIIMAVVGNLINNLLLGNLQARYQDANSEFSEMSSWTAHVQKLPLAWLRLLGVEDMPDIMFTDKQGIPNIIYIISALMLTVLPIAATFCYKKYGSDRKGRMMRIWVWMHWAVTAVVLMGYICGVLAVADWRLTPVVGTSLILSILFVCRAVSAKADCSRLVSLLIIPVFAAGTLSVSNVMKMPKDGYKQNTWYQLSGYLYDHGLTKGYSSFWNANSVTLISGGKVKVSDVYIDETGVSRRRYQSSTKWYEDDPLQQKYFLILEGRERNDFMSSEAYKNDIPQYSFVTEINSTKYTILVYDHNIV
ncbi:hypothetical protein SAMN02910265_00429 [Ruminococcus flavefaciens]|uniref:4-amino-4-deoxy-L-arabinose transferase n=1 Tax=Ruminococcus flavefaciens TaxID=1265 RepID=A0A1H6I283_RUMFL|nr:hypothetical protein [Ruminococcus flavefaciens]SEH40574.1 hypothetical protein SAMN02910265_00429 [Ruminococcus flavefaciens]